MSVTPGHADELLQIAGTHIQVLKGSAGEPLLVLHNPKLPAYLRGMKVPTLIVRGKYGAIIPLNCGELYQQALPNSRLHVIDRCGRSPALEKPQEFLQVVQEFLSRQN